MDHDYSLLGIDSQGEEDEIPKNHYSGGRRFQAECVYDVDSCDLAWPGQAYGIVGQPAACRYPNKQHTMNGIRRGQLSLVGLSSVLGPPVFLVCREQRGDSILAMVICLPLRLSVSACCR